MESQKVMSLGHRPTLKVRSMERLIPLAPGTVRADGWIRRLAEIEADGWLEMIVQKDEHNLRKSFYDASETPHGGEWSGYWNDSFIGLSILLGRLERVQEHVEAVLAAAQAKNSILSEYYNGWGTHLQVRALMTYFEATADERVLKLCHRAALELLEDLNSAEGHRFDGDHPVNMASSCAQIYGYTEDERMLQMAEQIMARFDAGGLPNLHRLLHDERLSGHGVNYCEDIRHPADVYLFSGNPLHLRASERGVELTFRHHMQVQGVPSGNEPVYGKGPMKETEHCDTVEWSFVGHAMVTATGDARYADMAEKALFNAWAGSRKWDARSLCYNHAPNQITASSWEGTWPPRMCYSPYHQPQCCNLNSHRAIHPWVFHMWMLTPDGGFAAVYYGGCRARIYHPEAGTVELVEETEYPFGEEVKVIVTPEKPAKFPIELRIPGWCEDARVWVNSEPAEGKPTPGSFFRLDRFWHPGDNVYLQLPMPIRLEWCETFLEPAFHDANHPDFNPEHTTQVGLREVDEPTPGKHLVAVSRGPLVYSLYIEPRFIVEQDEHGIEGYVVESVVPAESAKWNVALVLNKQLPEDSFQVINLNVPPGSEPFRHAPIGLKCTARIIPEWKPNGTSDKPLTSLPQFPYAPSGERIEVLLIPFGCTRIRLTWLPFVME